MWMAGGSDWQVAGEAEGGEDEFALDCKLEFSLGGWLRGDRQIRNKNESVPV